MSRLEPNRSAPVAPRVTAIAIPVALFYFLTIGGTFIGELTGLLRVINALLGGVLVTVYLLRAPTRHDRTDQAVVLSLILFTLAGAASAFPRQSLDAVIGALAFAAAFYVARDVTGNQVGSRTTIAMLRLLSLLVTGLLVSRIASINIEWLIQTGGLTPPIGLRFDAWPFGHPYDLVTLALMLFPSWMIGSPSRWRSVVATVIGALLVAIVIFAGARAIWLAVALATLVIAVPLGVKVARRQVRLDPRILIGAGLIILVGAIVLAGPILDRLLTSSTLDQRLEMWGSATEVWLERPLTGHGPGSFPWLLQTTDHFQGNTIHPRHPDSALFQLLPEAGLLGLASAGVLLAEIGIPLVSRSKGAAWAVALFVFGGIGGNPTDFPFLIVAAMTWAALGLPRPHLEAVSFGRRPALAWASFALLGVLAVAVIATLVGGLRYDSAVARVAAGDLNGARRDIGAAMGLDPTMAIYPRQRGIASLLLAEPEVAIADLRRATAINPNDDLNWRALAIAQMEVGELEGARASIDRALALQPSDVANLMLSAAWDLETGDQEAFEMAIAEIVLGWPSVISAPGWQEIGFSPSTTQVDAAIDRWLEQGNEAIVPINSQPYLLALIGDRADIVTAAEDASGLPASLAAAMRAVYWCEADAEDLLSGMPPAERRSSTYWGLRVQHTAEVGAVDPTALRLYELASGSALPPDATDRRLDPLHENNPQGSVDAWGYRRLPISWRSESQLLPSPDAGSARWLLEPATARASIDGPAGSASCD